MQGSLGEKIGEGHFAEVYAWRPGQVVKLFKAEIPGRIAAYEAHMTQAVFQAGGPAPEVLDRIKVDGRRGFVMPHLVGPTLRQRMTDGAVSIEAAGAILADLALAVHRTPAPADALSLHDYMLASLRVSEGRLPDHLAADLLELIARLPADDGLSHCDLHPGNVILTRDGPRLVDWTGVRRGGALYDLACAHFLRLELVPELLGGAEAQQRLDLATRSAYARLAGLDPDDLMAGLQSRLPLVRAFFLLGGMPKPATRERLLARLAQDLRPAPQPGAP